jgi:acetyl-CoA carboxylase carboxyl transferase subunit beta
MREFLRRHQPSILRERSESGREIPDNLWVKCPRCHELIYTKEFERTARVCQKCRYHFRLSASERIALLADPDSFTEHDVDLRPADPLSFVSADEAYTDKLVKTQVKTGLKDAVVCGSLTIMGQPLEVMVADFSFLGASMGSVFGEKLVRAADRARRRRTPLLTVSASGGARMHEGLFSLMQMAKTTTALVQLGAAGLPHISLLTDPCTGGVTASYAMQADVVLAEPGALIGFAGPRVIEQTIRQKLPEGFQTAEFQLQHGMIDAIVPRRELRDYLATLLGLYSGEQADEQRA